MPVVSAHCDNVTIAKPPLSVSSVYRAKMEPRGSSLYLVQNRKIGITVPPSDITPHRYSDVVVVFYSKGN